MISLYAMSVRNLVDGEKARLRVAAIAIFICASRC